MTVGIGIICDRGECAILAADRLSLMDPYHLAYETDHQKLSVLESRIALTVSGTRNELTEVVSSAAANRAFSQRAIGDVAKCVFQAREEFRSAQVEQTILRRRLNLSFSEFRQIVLRDNSVIAAELYQEIKRHSLAMQLLLAGADEGGAHLYVVDDGTSPANLDEVGFGAIGSGGPIAQAALIGHAPSRDLSVADALLVLMMAKVTAERCPTVGETTDIVIVRKNAVPLAIDADDAARLRKVVQPHLCPRFSESDLQIAAEIASSRRG